ncbi:MAG: glycoside hydrolase family 3 N-terminal domain-containing protein [Bacteroidota bacterium]
MALSRQINRVVQIASESLFTSGRVLLVSAFLLFIVSCTSERATRTETSEVTAGSPGVPIESWKVSEDDSEWVESTLHRMSLEEKVAQLVMPRAQGMFISEDSDEFQRLARLVKVRKVGGVVFFQGDVFETSYLINKLQSYADTPLLISADFEHGVAMRIERSTSFPYNMAVGATRDPQLAYEMGKITAEEGRALGVHQNYAPVVDVNSNPLNPVINVRSFGEDPRLVSEMADAFIRGMHDGKMISTAKHFPGHGDTEVDSHSELPVVTFDREHIEKLELAPFRDAIAHGVMSIMVAHLSVPAFDTARGVPSTLSPNIVSKLLKNELHFNGLIVTDAMTMRSVTKAYSPAEAAVLAVKAGNDIILMPQDEEAAIDALASATMRGELTMQRIDESVRKVLAAKVWLGLNRNRYVQADTAFAVVGSKDHQRVAREIARRSITLVKNEMGILPLEESGSKRVAVLIVSDDAMPTTGDRFAREFRVRYPDSFTLRVDARSNEEEYDSVYKELERSEMVVCPIYLRVRSGQGTIGLRSKQETFLERVMKLGKPTVAISFGNPYVLSDIRDVKSYLCAYSDVDASVDAAVEAMFGEIDVGGKLPITIPDLYPYGSGLTLKKVRLRVDEPEVAGFDSNKLKHLDDIVKKAIADSAFPAAEVLVAKDGLIVYNKAFGTYDYSPYSRQIDAGTMFDLASLTKVIGTTNAVMRLYDEKRLGLDDPVVKYVLKFGQNGKEKITIRNLLLHNSGLPALKKFYETCTSAEQLVDSVYATRLIYTTGDSTIYSDLGLITLGKVVEQIAGNTLDRYLENEFFKPLHMENTMYNPPEWRWDHIAPTEIDTVWRKQKTAVRGRVHDENASVLGGVSGHAGLFSNVSDLARMMQMLLNGGTYGGRRYLNEETVRLFTRRQSERSSRGLGWDMKNIHGYSSAGSLFSPKSFGHTGFTGTSVWADPERNLFVIFLTNRVNPTRENTKIFRIRPEIHDAVIEALKSQK